MAFWNRNEKRDDEDTGTVSFDAALFAALTGSTTATEQIAMELPAVRSAVGFLADTIASLPVRMYRKKGGKSREVLDDYRLELVNRETGDLLDAHVWKQAVVRDYLIYGSGYTYVDWDGNKVRSLRYVENRDVSAEVSPDPIFKSARFHIGGAVYPEFCMMRVLRASRDGVTGRGILSEEPTQLTMMYNTLKYENRMVRTGAKKGFLKAAPGKKLTQAAIDSLRSAWRNLYGTDSDETTVVLNDGVEFQDAGQTAVDTQLNENKNTNDHSVYKLFNIVSSVIEGGATQEDLKNTVRFAVRPVVKAMESALDRFLLLENEKGVLRFEIDMDHLDNADILTRYQAYEIAVRNGWMQLDEVRYGEGRNALGLDFVRLGLDTVIYDPKSKEIYTPNTKEWASIRRGGETDASGNQSGPNPDDGDGLRERDREGQQDPA